MYIYIYIIIYIYISTGMTPRCSAWKGLRGIVEDEAPPDTPAPSESWRFAQGGSESGRQVNGLSLMIWFVQIFESSAFV